MMYHTAEVAGNQVRKGINSGFLFLLFCRGEEDIVQDQAVARGIFVEVQIGWRIGDGMLVIFGIVTTVESKEAPSECAVEVLQLVGVFSFTEDDDRLFHPVATEHGGLPHKPLYHIGMTLR